MKGHPILIRSCLLCPSLIFPHSTPSHRPTHHKHRWRQHYQDKLMLSHDRKPALSYSHTPLLFSRSVASPALCDPRDCSTLRPPHPSLHALLPLLTATHPSRLFSVVPSACGLPWALTPTFFQIPIVPGLCYHNISHCTLSFSSSLPRGLWTRYGTNHVFYLCIPRAWLRLTPRQYHTSSSSPICGTYSHRPSPASKETSSLLQLLLS